MEKFPQYKAFVQINEAGNGIDIFEADTVIDDPNILKMSIEEAITFAKNNNKIFFDCSFNKDLQNYIEENV